jgi:hypothetical protein
MSAASARARSTRSSCGAARRAGQKRRSCSTSACWQRAIPSNATSGAWAVSPDNTRVAFTVDFSGDREFRIFVRAIAGGDIVDQGIDSAAAGIVFAADNRTLFYVRNEPQTLRSYQVWRHRIGSAAGNDVLVYEERDQTFSVSLDLSKSRKFILLDLDAERWREFRYLPVDQPTGEFRVIEPRRGGLVYEADHVGDKFFIRTNLDAPDFRLMSASETAPAAAHWREIVPQQVGRHLTHVEAFGEPLLPPTSRTKAGRRCAPTTTGRARDRGAAAGGHRRRLDVFHQRQRSQSRSGRNRAAFPFQRDAAAAMHLRLRRHDRRADAAQGGRREPLVRRRALRR